jgi:hypothetical protein
MPTFSSGAPTAVPDREYGTTATVRNVYLRLRCDSADPSEDGHRDALLLLPRWPVGEPTRKHLSHLNCQIPGDPHRLYGSAA